MNRNSRPTCTTCHPPSCTRRWWKQQSKHEVGQLGLAASRPRHDVVRSRPVDLAITSPARATVISSAQSSSRRRRHYPRRPTDIDHQRVGKKNARDGGVACNALQCPSRDRQRELEVGQRSSDLLLDAFQSGRQHASVTSPAVTSCSTSASLRSLAPAAPPFSQSSTTPSCHQHAFRSLRPADGSFLDQLHPSCQLPPHQSLGRLVRLLWWAC
jgi:hypothetical protein